MKAPAEDGHVAAVSSCKPSSPRVAEKRQELEEVREGGPLEPSDAWALEF